MAGALGRGDGALTAPAWLRWTWVVPGLFLLAFLAVPLGRLAAQVGADAAGLVSPATWKVAGLAAGQATLSTALALVAGIPIANVVTRYRFPGRALVLALVTVPFVLPTVVVALALRSLLGPVTGIGVVVLAHAYVNLAVVVRVVGSQWAQLDDRRESVGRTLGATRWTAFRTVTLPSLRASVASSAAVVFVFSFTSLGIILIVGDSTTRTLEGQVLRQTSVLLDFPGAAASAIVQLVLVTCVLLLGVVVSRRTPTIDPGLARLHRAESRSGRVAVAATAAGTVALVLAPIIALVLASLRAASGWGLQWWRSLGSIDAGTTRIGSPLDAVLTSLGYALTTALVAGVVGGLAAIAILSHGRRRWIAVASLAPLGVSAATLGLGLVLAYGRGALDLRGTGLLVPMAHALVAVPLVVAVAAPALRSADARRAAVAATLGARPTRAFLAAYGQVLRVVAFASAALAGAVSLGEFGAASFLAREGSPTVPVQIVRLLSRPGEANAGVAAALAVMLVALTLLLVLVADRLGRRSVR